MLEHLVRPHTQGPSHSVARQVSTSPPGTSTCRGGAPARRRWTGQLSRAPARAGPAGRRAAASKLSGADPVLAARAAGLEPEALREQRDHGLAVERRGSQRFDRASSDHGVVFPCHGRRQDQAQVPGRRAATRISHSARPARRAGAPRDRGRQRRVHVPQQARGADHADRQVQPGQVRIEEEIGSRNSGLDALWQLTDQARRAEHARGPRCPSGVVAGLQRLQRPTRRFDGEIAIRLQSRRARASGHHHGSAVSSQRQALHRPVARARGPALQTRPDQVSSLVSGWLLLTRSRAISDINDTRYIKAIGHPLRVPSSPCSRSARRARSSRGLARRQARHVAYHVRTLEPSASMSSTRRRAYAARSPPLRSLPPHGVGRGVGRR